MAATAKPAVAFGRGPQQLVVRRRVKTPKAGAKPAPAAADKITHPSVAFLFDPERDAASAQPYWTLGDEAMETEAALRERAELRTHPAVQDAIRRLGNAAFARDAEGFIVQEEYERVHARIARVLAPGMPEADAAEAAAAEWQADAHGQDRIDDSRLIGSVPAGRPLVPDDPGRGVPQRPRGAPLQAALRRCCTQHATSCLQRPRQPAAGGGLLTTAHCGHRYICISSGR